MKVAILVFVHHYNLVNGGVLVLLDFRELAFREG
jgi:hypothetical protein